MQIIALDFDGTLIKHEPSDKAHQEWFEIMASALNDNSIKDYAKIKDYFPKVYEIMQRYTGLNANNEFDKKLMRQLARNLFQMSYLGYCNKHKDEILYKEFADFLRELKKDYKLVLVTTAPEDSVRPILELTNCDDLFDIIYKSPLVKEPNKTTLMKEFIQENEKPLCYIGNSNEDVDACKELDIKSVLVTWDESADKDSKADYVVSNVDELKKVISKL